MESIEKDRKVDKTVPYDMVHEYRLTLSEICGKGFNLPSDTRREQTPGGRTISLLTYVRLGIVRCRQDKWRERGEDVAVEMCFGGFADGLPSARKRRDKARPERGRISCN